MAESRNAKVVKILNQFEVVINRGSEAGVSENDVFLVYALGEEVKDPDTGESLGKLEIVRGRAKVTHVQETMATLRSIETKSEPFDRKRPRLRAARDFFDLNLDQSPDEYVTELVEVPAPFRNAIVGDLARRL